jgi:hypothetical protein
MSKQYYYIQTVAVVVKENNTGDPIDLSQIQGAFDFSIKSGEAVGGAVITVIINGINAFVINPGDQMFGLGGYEDCVRQDKIEISFSTGSGTAYCFINKRVKEAACLF